MSSTTVGQETSLGYGQLIRDNRNFRYLWFGQIVSLLGDWFNLIASAALVATLTQSGTAIGTLFVVRMLAPFLISPIAGVVADRYNRKSILIATDLVRVVAVLGFLLVRRPDQVWLLYVLTALQLGISGFFFPTRNAILPDIVPPQGIGAANALSSATWSVMLALGAAIGGLVAGVWGSDVAFIIDALTFVLSAFFILQLKYTPTANLTSSYLTVQAALRQYLDGLHYLGQHLDTLVITLHKAAVALFIAGGFQVIQVAISEQVYVLGEGGSISLGVMFGIAGVGTGIGPIIARIFTGDREHLLRQTITIAYILSIIGLAIAAPLFNFSLTLFGIGLRGIGGGIVWVFSTQLLLQLTPGNIRGRVFATEFAFFNLATALSAALSGWTLETWLGISGSIWLMAGLSLIPTGLWILWMTNEKHFS